MSAQAVSSAIGEDGIQVAAKTLKEIANGDVGPQRQEPTTSERLEAAQTLLCYGLAHVDEFGNTQVGP